MSNLLPAQALQITDTHSILGVGEDSSNSQLISELNSLLFRLALDPNQDRDEEVGARYVELYEAGPFNMTILTLVRGFLGAAISTENHYLRALRQLLRQTSTENRTHVTAAWLYQAIREHNLSMRMALRVFVAVNEEG